MRRVLCVLPIRRVCALPPSRFLWDALRPQEQTDDKRPGYRYQPNDAQLRYHLSVTVHMTPRNSDGHGDVCDRQQDEWNEPSHAVCSNV